MDGCMHGLPLSLFVQPVPATAAAASISSSRLAIPGSKCDAFTPSRYNRLILFFSFAMSFRMESDRCTRVDGGGALKGMCSQRANLGKGDLRLMAHETAGELVRMGCPPNLNADSGRSGDSPRSKKVPACGTSEALRGPPSSRLGILTGS